jgi:acyl dehydratase
MITQTSVDQVDRLDPFTFAVDDVVQGQYLEALEDYHLRYTRLTGTPVVHPGILLSHSNAPRSPSFGGPNTQWIHIRERSTFVAPARIGDTLTVTWSIDGHEPWFGRTVTEVGCVVSRDDGQVVLRRTSWGIRTTGRAEPPARTAVMAGRPHPLVPPAQTGTDPVGRDVAGRAKHVTMDRIRLFSGWQTRNLHNDEEVARRAGLVAPIASATQGMGYLCEFLIDNLGERWLSGGSCALTFRKPIFADDRMTARGTVDAVSDGAVALTVRLLNQDGYVITDGTAST